MRPVRWSRVTNRFAQMPTGPKYASRADSHGPAGHHTGVDFGRHLLPLKAIEGLPVRSSTPGVVVVSDYDATLGNWVAVYYARDDVTISYWHLAKRHTGVGQVVAMGDVVGFVGSTGNSTAAHLHVQANRGRGLDYHGHIHPGRWISGTKWWKTFTKGERGKDFGAE